MISYPESDHSRQKSAVFPEKLNLLHRHHILYGLFRLLEVRSLLFLFLDHNCLKLRDRLEQILFLLRQRSVVVELGVEAVGRDLILHITPLIAPRSPQNREAARELVLLAKISQDSVALFGDHDQINFVLSIDVQSVDIGC